MEQVTNEIKEREKLKKDLEMQLMLTKNEIHEINKELNKLRDSP